MSISASRLWQQVALGEDTGLELKEVRFRGLRVVGPRRDDLADELAACANGRGGRLVLGVANDRRPQGLDPAQLDALADLVTEICSDSVKPPLDFSLFRVAVPEPGGGRGAGRRSARGGDRASVAGRAFPAPGGQEAADGCGGVRRLAQARGQSDAVSADTQVVRNSGINSLRPELWRQYASSRADGPPEIALSKLKFLKDDRHGALRATVGGGAAGGRGPARVAAERVDTGGVLRRRAGWTRAGRSTRATSRDPSTGRFARPWVSWCATAAWRHTRTRPAPTCRSSANERSSRRWSTRWCIATTRCRGSRIRLFMFDDRLELYSPGGLCNSHDDRRPAHQPVHAQRAVGVAVGPVPGRRRAGRPAAGSTSSSAAARASRSSRTRPSRSPASGRCSSRWSANASCKRSPAGGPAAGGGGRAGQRHHPARRHGPTAAGCERADALSQPNVS